MLAIASFIATYPTSRIMSQNRTSGQLPEPASGVGRCSTADESHAEPHAPITAGLPVIQTQSREGAANRRRRVSPLRVADSAAKRSTLGKHWRIQRESGLRLVFAGTATAADSRLRAARW